MIHAAVDTTALFADPMMRSAPWRELLTAAREGRVQLTVPEVVLREAARHFAATVRKAGKNLTDGLGSLRQIGVQIEAPSSADVRTQLDAVIAHYDAKMREVLHATGAVLLPLPKVSHASVLDRDLSERKPFDAHGKGYRDTLIWLSIIEYAAVLEASDILLIVTNNGGDFADRDTDALAGSLQEDLAAADVVVPVELVRDLAGCLARIPAEAEVERDEPAPIDETDGAIFSAVGAAITSLCSNLAGSDVATVHDPESGGIPFDDDTIPAEIDGPTIDVAEPDLGTLDIQIVEEFQQTTLLIEATVEAQLTIDGFMYKGDWALALDDVDTLDADWNDHMAWVSVAREAQLRFRARVELPGDVQDLDLVEMRAV